MALLKNIEELKENINSLQEEYLPQLEDFEADLISLTKVSNIAVENWVGDWFDKTEFYRDFVFHKEKYIKLNYETLYDFVSRESGVDYNSINEQLKEILKKFKNINELILIELSVIKGKEQFLAQIKILDKLEEYEWEYPAFKIIESQQPKTFIGDYGTGQRILANGFETPIHIEYSANILSTASLIISLKEYLKLSYRLLREIELVLSTDNKYYTTTDNPIESLNKLFNSFHDVARLLVNRHGNRPTITISDEYDTQDLLRSLLKIFFDDVRPEDYSPSYAGRNTRIDFLLKKEKIVVEVKKTRETLKDKEIGDELLQDIARYRNHPDCKILYCFIYDPQGFIVNPRGLEDDLASESNDRMSVYVSIRP